MCDIVADNYGHRLVELEAYS